MVEGLEKFGDRRHDCDRDKTTDVVEAVSAEGSIPLFQILHERHVAGAGRNNADDRHYIADAIRHIVDAGRQYLGQG